jgi:hypothetical protein
MYRGALANILPQDKAAQYFSDIRRSRDLAWNEQDSNIVSQDYILNAALVHAALNTRTFEFHSEAQSFVWDWVCDAAMHYTPFGRAWMKNAPALGDTVLAAGLAQLYAIRTRKSSVRAAVPMLLCTCCTRRQRACACVFSPCDRTRFRSMQGSGI